MPSSLPPCPEGKFRNPETRRCKKYSEEKPAKSDYYMRKLKGKDCYSVRNRKTKRVFAKCTTKDKAIRQLKILRAKLYNK